MEFNKENLGNRKIVIQALTAVLIGNLLGCILIAPIFQQGDFWSNAWNNLTTMGVSNLIALAIAAVIWLTVIYFKNKNQE